MSACETWPDLWFEGDPNVAIQLCCECPLMTPCLNLALRGEGAASASTRFGIFGGVTPEQRAAMAFADKRNQHERVTA